MSSLSCRGRLVHDTILAIAACSAAALAQIAPGLRTFGSEDFVEVVPGTLPVVLSAGHGGGLRPTEIPDRTYGVVLQDVLTEPLARELAAALAARTGRLPHLVISHLHRSKLDPNRDIVEGAQGDPRAELAWHEYHAAIERARQQVTSQWGRGLYVDVHGHGHTIQRIEWGYALTAVDYRQPDPVLDTPAYVTRSTVRHAAQLPGARLSLLLRGADSFGGLMQAHGHTSVPSPGIPSPGNDPYFSGGYSVRRYGSRDGGTIDGVQVEFQSDLRRIVAARRAMVPQFADAIVVWLDRHLAIDATAGTKISVRALEPVTTESGTPAILRVERTGAMSAPVTVAWSIAGSALQTLDVRLLPATVTIPAGHTFVDVPVEPLPDALDEGDETVQVQLFGGREIGWPASAEVVVRDDGADPHIALHLPLDEVAGGSTPDVSGRGRDAVLLPSAASGPSRIAQGVVGPALAFDGRDDALRIADHDYAVNGSFTLVFWMRTPPPAPGEHGYRYVVSHAAYGAASSLNVYFLEESRTLRTFLRFANARSPSVHLDVPDDLMDGTWHHYALSATARGTSFVAIDGEVRAENPHSGDAYDPVGPLFIGGRSDGNPERFCEGAIDDLRLFGRALGAAEIRVLRDARPGTVRTYGTACPVGAEPLQSTIGKVETNRRFVVAVDGDPSVPVFLGLGLRDDFWSGHPLPFRLDGLQAPGCSVWQDLVDILGGSSDPSGRAVFPFVIPRTPGLVGARFYTQAFLLVPAANPFGLAATGGQEITLGGQL